MHILFVTFFSLCVLHLQVDVVSPLLLNASLLWIHGYWLQWLISAGHWTYLQLTVTVSWVLTIVWLNNIEMIDEITGLILFDKWNQVLKIKRNERSLPFHSINFFNRD